MTVRGGGLLSACPVVVGALVTALLLGSPATSAPLAGCTDSQLVPRVAQLLVSQGAPGYSRLARGKEAIVRAYLTTPTTCTLSNKQSITPVSATLNVSYSIPGSSPQLSSYDPLTGKLGTAVQAYSTSDPYFVVPASYLSVSTGTPPPKFDVTFTLGLTYTRNTSATQFTTISGMTAATATVDQQTKALRILVVPMGDRSSATAQWTQLAETTLDNILANAGRSLPVPSAVTKELSSSSTTPTAGIRYRISGDLLDVKALGLYNSTKFCANAATWTTTQQGATGTFAGKTLKTELQDRLDNYNLYNTPPADLVLGVIEGANAWKSSEGIAGGCDDGRAATPDPNARTPGELAWVRVDTGTYPTPLQMELAHTLGVVDPGVRPTFHGLEVQTDAALPDKVYNVLQRKVVTTGTATGVVGANDHSILNYDTTTIPYTKDNTLAFSRDWDDALCDLGGFESNPVGAGLPFATCTISTGVGTDVGVAAGPGQLDMFHIDGHLSGTDVAVNDANIAAGDGELGIGAAGSALHLLLCEGPCPPAGTGATRDVPLALSGQAPIDANHIGPAGPTAPDEFSALVSLNSGSVTFTCAELKLGTDTKFSSCEDDPDPDIRSTSITGALLASFTPDICCNGRAIAFDGTNLYVTVAGSAAAQNIYKLSTSGNVLGSVPTGTTIGALAFDSGHLYGGNYEGTGEVYDINPSTGAKSAPLFTFDDDSCNNFIDGLEFLAGTPNRFAISGDICQTVYLKNMDGTPAGSLQATTGGGNSGITTDGAGGLWLAILNTESVTAGTILKRVDLSGNAIGEPINIVGYEAEDLAYDSVTFAPDCAVWMNQAIGGNPLIRAVSVPCGAGGAGGDEAIGVWTRNAEFVTLFAVCGAPTDVTNTEVEKFSLGTYVPDANDQTIVPFTDDRYCNNATIVSEASNGWDSTGLTEAQGSTDVDPQSQPPDVNIAAPFHGAKFRLGDTIHYEGYATDAEDGEIVDTLRWFDNGNAIPQGDGKTSFDLPIPSSTPTGNHTIRLQVTDSNSNTRSVFVTIQIKPKVCSSSSGCP